MALPRVPVTVDSFSCRNSVTSRSKLTEYCVETEPIEPVVFGNLPDLTGCIFRPASKLQKREFARRLLNQISRGEDSSQSGTEDKWFLDANRMDRVFDWRRRSFSGSRSSYRLMHRSPDSGPRHLLLLKSKLRIRLDAARPEARSSRFTRAAYSGNFVSAARHMQIPPVTTSEHGEISPRSE